MDFWQTIVATSVGGVITLIATCLTSRGQRKLESSKRLLDKIERAHELTSAIEHSYRMQCATDLAFVESGVRHPDFAPREQLPFEALQMYMAFYAPDLTDDVARLLTLTRGDYGKLISRVDSEREVVGEGKSELQRALREKFEEIKSCIGSLQDGLVERGRALI